MSFPRYANYRDSGVDWLGDIPQQWAVKRLRFVCDIRTGGKDTVDAVEDGEFPFFVRSQTVERINTWSEECEAVLTAGDGVGVGKVFHHYTGRFDYHQRVYAFTNFKGISGDFFFYYIRENFYKVALEGGAKSTVDSLRMPLIQNFTVCIPPSFEQKAITVFLDRETAKIDALVGEQRLLIELLKEKRQAVISQAVTRGLDSMAPMRDSGVEGLGPVPKHWRVMTVRRVASRVQTGTTPSTEPASAELEEGVAWYTPVDFRDSLRLTVSSKTLSLESSRSGEARLFDPGSVLVVGIGATLGKVGYIDRLSSANQQINAITPNANVDGFFLAYSLSVKAATMKVLSNASTIGIMNQEKTKEIPLAVPPPEEQLHINAFLDTATCKIDQLVIEAETAITLLQERRSALITAAVTGKIDVRDQGSKAEAA